MPPDRPVDGPGGAPGAAGITPPSAASIIRRALLAWGLGHVALGDRRGWVLLALEVAGIASIAALATAFLDGSRAVIVFLALAVFFACWGMQAVDAHRKAVAAGGRPGGAVQLLALAPILGVTMTGFWLVAGSSGSPEATLQRYMYAWQDARPEAAADLFLVPPAAQELRERWTRDEAYLRQRLAALSMRPGSRGAEHGLDPMRPFRSLAVTLGDDPRSAPDVPGTAGDRAVAYLQIVRPVRRQTTFLGIFPAARQEMEPVETVGRVVLRAVPLDPAVGLGADNEVWRLESLEIGAP